MNNQNQIDTQNGSGPVNPLKNEVKGWSRDQDDLNGSLYLSEIVEQHSHLLISLLGYGLLLFALFDYIHIVIPPRFTNPLQEFQMIGAVVEHAVVPLVGLIFIFYRTQGYVKKLEKKLLGFFSWASLLVGILYLLIIPLCVADAWRIYYANNAQIAYQSSQQSQHFQEIKRQLDETITDEQVTKLASELIPQIRSPHIKNTQAFKDQLRGQVSQAEKSMQIRAYTARTNQMQSLIKDSVKWNLGALVSGILFILIWYFTGWTRMKDY